MTVRLALVLALLILFFIRIRYGKAREDEGGCEE